MKYTIEASFAYSLTVPGEQPYSSSQVRSALTITEDIDAESKEQASAFADLRLAELAQQVKVHAINEAGLGASVDANGVVVPVFGGQTNVTAISAAPSYDPTPDESGAIGSISPDGNVYTAPTPNGASSSPMWDGRPIKIWDNRLSKKNPKAPDLRIQFLDKPDAPDDDKFKAFWIENRDGTQNTAALKVLVMLDQQA